MAFQGEGQRLITYAHGQFRAWDIPTTPPVAPVPIAEEDRHPEFVSCMDRAGTFAILQNYHDLFCYEVSTGKTVWQQDGKGAVRGLLALSPDGAQLAIGGGNEQPRIVELINVLTGQTVMRLGPQAGSIMEFAFSADGRSLATVSAEAGVQRWDISTGKVQQDYPYAVPAWKSGAPVFSADGRWLAVVGLSASPTNSRLGVFRVDTGELVWEIRPSNGVAHPPVALAFSPDGNVLYAGTQAWQLR